MGQISNGIKWALCMVLLWLAPLAFANTVNFEVIEYLPENGITSVKQLLLGNQWKTEVNKRNLISEPASKSPLFIEIKVFGWQTSNPTILQILNPILDEVTLYRINKNGLIDSITQNEIDIKLNRTLNEPNYHFLLDSADVNQRLILKVNASEQFLIPIEVGDTEVIKNNNQYRDIVLAFYLGIMLVMFLYNLFLFINTKDWNYLYYILYILTVGLTQVTFHGYFGYYFPAKYPFIKSYFIHFMGMASGITTVVFTMHFLNTKQYLGKWNLGLYSIIVLEIIALLPLLFSRGDVSYNIINLTVSLGSLYVLIAANYIARKGNKTAFFFLIAWSVFLGSAILFVLKDFGIIPYNNFTRFILLYGSASEVTLLSFALAGKINLLKREKEIAQENALRIAEENAIITQKQNIILEAKVVERTKEITEANNQLHLTLNDLKQAQTQLIESEKMASLGQLTAGIAHEINNPINFVTSNVNPLKRDINQIYATLDEVELLLQNHPELQAKVNHLKQEHDLNYIKQEIEFLLKGIFEGSSRTAEIVKGLRIFSRIDEHEMKQADINECLDSTLIIVNNQLNNKIDIIKNYGPIPPIECYPGKLNQVFLNLITNGIYAIKQQFNGESGGILTIETKEVENHIIIDIKDNGIGMDEVTKTKLFEPFFTTKPVGDGTGLGLSIVYNTIKKHQGKITVTTAIGSGTTFTITLPKNLTHEQA